MGGLISSKWRKACLNGRVRHDPKSNGEGLDSMKKRVLSLLLCLAFLLALLPAAARADGACGDNLAWSFDDTAGKLTITGTGDMWDWSYSNTPWEAYMNRITSVELPVGLTTIGGRAFCGTKITGIEIPGTVTAIAGSYAFSECTGLTHITFPGSLTSIGQDAFSGCTGLTSLTIPGNVVEVNSSADPEHGHSKDPILCVQELHGPHDVDHPRRGGGGRPGRVHGLCELDLRHHALRHMALQCAQLSGF